MRCSMVFFYCGFAFLHKVIEVAKTINELRFESRHFVDEPNGDARCHFVSGGCLLTQLWGAIILIGLPSNCEQVCILSVFAYLCAIV